MRTRAICRCVASALGARMSLATFFFYWRKLYLKFPWSSRSSGKYSNPWTVKWMPFLCVPGTGGIGRTLRRFLLVNLFHFTGYQGAVTRESYQCDRYLQFFDTIFVCCIDYDESLRYGKQRTWFERKQKNMINMIFLSASLYLSWRGRMIELII